jgi:hypothetical protein
MSGQIDPIGFPQVWDYVTVADHNSPGVCQVSGFRRDFEWDIKKGKGALGATISFVQRPPAKGTIKFLLWTADHFTQWDTFRPLLKYDPTKKSVQAIDLYHPSLADIDLSSVVTESIGAIVHEGQGLYSISVDFLEYFPPPKKSATGTPSGSASTAPAGTSAGAPPDPIADAQQKEIAALLAEAQKP